MEQSKLPPGWDEKRVKEVLAYYESQTESEALAGVTGVTEVDDYPAYGKAPCVLLLQRRKDGEPIHACGESRRAIPHRWFS